MSGSHLEVRKIHCSECAAPLQLFGGHKVDTITCRYCGSVLDPHNDYAVLKAHRAAEEKRRVLPLKLGMRGILWNVEFTVIGLLTFQDDWDVWTDFCLFSPTHGYVWLTWERGHFVLMRRERDQPRPVGSWNNFATRQSIWMGARQYAFYEAYSGTIMDVAGELPWRAEVGDSSRFADAVAPPYLLTQEQNGAELEYYAGEFIEPAVVQKAFDLPFDLPRPSRVHPAQPFLLGAVSAAMGFAGKVWGVIALLALLFVVFAGSGNKLLWQQLSWQQLAAAEGISSHTFKVEDADQLLQLTLHSPVNNGWMWIDVELTRDNEEVFSIGKEISYYHGVEGGESWSEGSQEANAFFKVPAPGTYAFSLQASERGGYRSQTPVTIEVRDGVILTRWFLVLFIIMLIAALWPIWRKMRFEHARWAPVTEDDDDDD